jgi:hypothetical protein
MVPNSIPSVPASEVKPKLRPMLGPTKPMAMVKKWKLPRNQNGTWSITRPCRSCSPT